MTFSNDGRVECVAKCDFVSELTRPKSIKLNFPYNILNMGL